MYSNPLSFHCLFLTTPFLYLPLSYSSQLIYCKLTNVTQNLLVFTVFWIPCDFHGFVLTQCLIYRQLTNIVWHQTTITCRNILNVELDSLLGTNSTTTYQYRFWILQSSCLTYSVLISDVSDNSATLFWIQIYQVLLCSSECRFNWNHHPDT